MEVQKKTKIVATIGPASDKKEIIQELYDSGVNVFRLNFSHGTHESHGKVIDLIRSLNLNVLTVPVQVISRVRRRFRSRFLQV